MSECYFTKVIVPASTMILLMNLKHLIFYFAVEYLCGGVIIPIPFWTFGNDLLYRARIAFLWGATAISKNEV